MSAADRDIAAVLIRLGAEQPHAPAIHVPGHGALTFGALAAHAGYVRDLLGGWGLRPGDVVAGFSALRPQMAVAIATFPSACTFAPLGSTLSRELYSETLVRMRAKAVAVDAGSNGALRAAADDLGIGVLELQADAVAGPGLFELSRLRRVANAELPPLTSAEHGYVISSSGTTGRRKLVPLSHQHFIVLADAMAERLSLDENDVGVHLMPMHYAHGVNAALMSPLLTGRSIVCLPEADVPAFFESIGEFAPTYVSASFAIFQEIARRAPDYADAISRCRLRFMRSGSGPLAPEVADRLEQIFDAPMLNGLATTESGRIALDRFPRDRRRRGSVGLPLLNEVEIVDAEGVPVPRGERGEIVTRGSTVFAGYIDDPELTAASFFGDWYRTGDLGSVDADGYLYLHGRIREVINRGGEKISPVEIDLAIEALAGVREAAVFGVPHPSLGQEIVAAVVRAPGADIDAATITGHVRATLGGERVPRQIHFVESLPRTGNGKLRRSEMAVLIGHEPAGEKSKRKAGTGSDASPMEIAVGALWAAILDLDGVEPDTDFFLLGGDSMSGGQLLARVRAVLGVELEIRDLFGESATVAGMARAVEQARMRGAGSPQGIGAGSTPTATIPARSDKGPAPLSFPQQRLWILARLEPHGPAYNAATARTLEGKIDVDALRLATSAVIARHDVLRTTFELTDAGPVQVIHADAVPDFAVIDLSSTRSDKRDAVLADTLAAIIDEPFSLERGPLLRLRLINVDDRRHVLLRVWHHIVTDLWSGAIFSRDLSVAYGQVLAGRPPDLPPLRVQYADFALWQRQEIAQGVMDRQIAFWKVRLEGLAPIDIATDHPRPSVASHRGDRLVTELPLDLVEGLEALARRERATLFMALLAAFQVLLHRYTGATDIAVGAPVAGRRHPEVEDLIGFFLNTLVLRVDLSAEPTFVDALARTRDATLAALENQDVPFERVVEEMALARDPSRNPLFQIAFAFWNAPDNELTLEGVEARRVALPGRSSKFELSLNLRRSPRGMDATWEYCTDLFDRPTIARLATCFAVLVNAIVAEPRRPIGTLPLLSEAQRRRVLVEWNAVAADYPRQATLHSLVEAQAARIPRSVAVRHEAMELSYGDLNRKANRFASLLAQRGVRRGDTIAVCLARTPKLLIVLLGIMKAGAAYLPFDVELPGERLAFMIDDAGAKIVVVDNETAGALPATCPTPLLLDDDLFESETDPGAFPKTKVGPTDLAYVIYTSGSTGCPKGVEVTHGAVVNLLCALTAHPGCSDRDRVLALTTISFDIAVVELFLPLSVGALVELASRETAQDPRLLRRLIQRTRPTIVYGTPTAWRMLIESGWRGAEGLVALCGAERLPRDLADLLLARTSAVWNLYGPTETTICCTADRVEPGLAEVTIGRPVHNTEAYILDGHLQPVPIGVPGELFIAGVCLARGYRNRPELTADRFLTHAFSSAPAARMYRTGDRARWNDDGRIAFLGRFDDQVKLRGFRIELGEIEATLVKHQCVSASVAVIREAGTSAAHLTAYVVPSSGSHVDVGQLRDWLLRWLPTYMIPSRIVVLERLPMMTSGKIDYRSLPPPRDEPSRALEPPADGSVVSTIIDVWKQTLKIQAIGPDDDFFRLGGHSLLAANVVRHLSAAFAIEVPLRLLFETPSAIGLARKIAELKEQSAGRQLGPVVRKGKPKAHRK
ncbi:MAG: amino acid adenylation domain-containing protein [Betaproteobacteria bacterium]